jgi:hypothetical protein
MDKKRLEKNSKKAILENYHWFSKFSPVEKLRLAKKAGNFLKILKGVK